MSIEKNLQRAIAQVDELVALTREPEDLLRAETDVSRWTILAHADHLARSGHGVVGQIERAAAAPPDGPGIKPLGRLVLALGWIPRGRGKAIEVTLPQTGDPAEVAADLEKLRRELADLGRRHAELARARGGAPHPYFGHLTPAQWARFQVVHQAHHLKIVADIRRAAAG